MGFDSWCPQCHGRMVDYMTNKGDYVFYCASCKTTYERYGFQGPLCVKEI